MTKPLSKIKKQNKQIIDDKYLHRVERALKKEIARVEIQILLLESKLRLVELILYEAPKKMGGGTMTRPMAKEFDYRQYKNYPSLIFMFKKLNQENLRGRKTASRFVDKYNVYLRWIYDSNMTFEAKQVFYCLVKKLFKSRLGDIRNLGNDNLNNLNAFIMGRWRKYMGYEICKKPSRPARDTAED